MALVTPAAEIIPMEVDTKLRLSEVYMIGNMIEGAPDWIPEIAVRIDFPREKGKRLLRIHTLCRHICYVEFHLGEEIEIEKVLIIPKDIRHSLSRNVEGVSNGVKTPYQGVRDVYITIYNVELTIEEDSEGPFINFANHMNFLMNSQEREKDEKCVLHFEVSRRGVKYKGCRLMDQSSQYGGDTIRL